MSDQLEQQILPDDALQELRQGAGWLEGAQFEQLEQESYEYCTEAEKLASHFGKVLAHFSSQFPANETRITALRFKMSASIPVKEGSTVDVIPVLISDAAKINDRELVVGEHLRLTKEAKVEPTFYCLLLLTQGPPGA